MHCIADQIRQGTCALAIMPKPPSAGQVKTRLSPALTPDEAAALSSCLLRDTATIMQMATTDERVQKIAVYTPASASSIYKELLPAEFFLVPQRGETLPERIVSAF